MKKTIKIGLAVAMIVFATMVTVFGSELPVNVVASGEKSVNLYFGEIKGKVWISVYDEQGYILHSKTLKDIESYGIQYDLSDLPNGTYVLAMERDDQTKNVSLTIGNGIVSVNNHYVSKPALKVANQKVTVALNQTNEDTWKISIEDLERNIVFQGTMEGYAQQTYDLSNLPVGEYLFEMKTKGNSYTERITLKK